MPRLITWIQATITLSILAAVISAGFASIAAAGDKASQAPTVYARFQTDGGPRWGLVENDAVREIDGSIYGSRQTTGKSHRLGELRLLVPAESTTQVLALAGNYRSHLPGEEIAEKFRIPQPFFKSPSSLAPHGANIVIPPGTAEVHYEAELVVVIGRETKNVTPDEAREHILGITGGNDVSARDWQKSDVQWWRAKGCDTFGPCGPFLVTGLNYDELLLQLRLNGEVKQKQSTRDLIHDVASTVSVISRHITLHPGDLIFTGTPGKTSAIKPGDVVEVELEGVGTLRNKVVAAP
jgi:2-keto-4-pentenoate hydratase/2-oxohepta-3-ene-1,7-dioic acid hydratase in catechol pathway